MNVLVVKTSSLGDLIHVFPVVEYLKSKYPDAKIDWVVEKPFEDVIKAHPFVNQVLTINTKKWRKSLWKPSTWQDVARAKKVLQKTRYDVVFDLQGNVKSGIITSCVHSNTKVGFSKESVAERPNLLFTNEKYTPPPGQNIRSDYLSIVQQHFQDSTPFNASGIYLAIDQQERVKIKDILRAPALQAGHCVMVCSGSNWPNKQLSTETLLGFLRMLAEEQPTCFLFAWGNAEEKAAAVLLQEAFPANSIILERQPLPVLQNIMAEMDLVVAMDSLPLHLAATTGTPTFGVFGASSAAKYRPEGVQHATLQGVCPYGRRFEKRCPVLRTCPTGSCIKELTPEVLFEAKRK